MMSPAHIAVIGSGIAGLTCAIRLQKAGATVTLFDKSRGAGGRACTRRAAAARFDHGAQYFTTRDPDFEAAVQHWHQMGWVQPWNARFGQWKNGAIERESITQTRWVGTPRMSIIGKMMAQTLDVRLQHKVTAITANGGKWSLTFDETSITEQFDWVVLTCPGPQAANLLPPDTAIRRSALALSYEPCWALMASFGQPLAAPLDGLHIAHPTLAWAARDSAKPCRDAGERWVVHAQSAWSQAHVNASPEEVTSKMISALGDVLNETVNPQYTSAHRWLYARPSPPPPGLVNLDVGQRLAICGDGLHGPRVENAWLSGQQMADSILKHLN